MLTPLIAGLLLADPTFPLPTPRPEAAPPAAEAKPLAERLTFQADARLRAESTFDQPNGEDRHRGRLRGRLGAMYEVSPDLRAGARLTTLSDGRDANNPHWDFGDGADGFSAAEIGLDRLYLEWRACADLALTGGKFGHPFARPPVLGELAWDDDVQPAGVAAVWRPNTDGALRGDLRALYGVAAELNGADDAADPTFLGAQASGTWAASDSLELSLATSLTDWSSLSGFPALDQGNTADAGGFAVWDTFLSGTWSDGPLGRTTGFVQLLENLDDDSGEDSGFAVGAQVGRGSGAGAWSAFLSLYWLDANCVFSPVAQDDTPIPGTGVGEGMKGIVGGTEYRVSEALSVRLWALTSDADAADDPWRVRLDLNLRVL